MITPTPRDKTSGYLRIRDTLLSEEPICRMCKNNIATIVDHIVPLFLGGSNEQDNLQPLCEQCHHDKSMLERGIAPSIKLHPDGSPKGISNLDLRQKKDYKYRCYLCGMKVHIYDTKEQIIAECGEDGFVEVYHLSDNNFKCGPMMIMGESK